MADEYKCEYCGKTFKTQDDLTKHLIAGTCIRKKKKKDG